MRILFDLKSPQHFIGGCSEYIRKVFYSLINEIRRSGIDVELIGLTDSRIGHFANAELAPETIKEYDVKIVDIANSTLKEILDKEKIDKVFIGGAQYWGEYDVENIKCPVVCVIHDLCDEEYDRNRLDEYFRLDKFNTYLRYKFHVWRNGKRRLEQNEKIFNMLRLNKEAQIITVSNYSRNSIIYNYNIDIKKIKVLYSPERITVKKEYIENECLKKIIVEKRKYYLMLSANRINKNPYKTIRAFKRYHDLYDEEALFITVGFPEKQYDSHIILPYLSESDLAYIMENCYAFVFPSYFEGFGYPPIEAMKYGKPVLCSNTTSIPEVCGDAAIYFSPYYETDIFSAFCKLNKSNYDKYSECVEKRWYDIQQRQEKDIETLIHMLLKDDNYNKL